MNKMMMHMEPRVHHLLRLVVANHSKMRYQYHLKTSIITILSITATARAWQVVQLLSNSSQASRTERYRYHRHPPQASSPLNLILNSNPLLPIRPRVIMPPPPLQRRHLVLPIPLSLPRLREPMELGLGLEIHRAAIISWRNSTRECFIHTERVI